MSESETEPGEPPRQNGDAFELRARPAPVSRINRKVLFAAIGLLLLILAGTVIVALDPPRFASAPPQELIGDRPPRPPEGLESLPKDYGDLPPPVADGPVLIEPQPSANPIDGLVPLGDEGDRLEGEARKAPIAFRLELKLPLAPRRETAGTGIAREQTSASDPSQIASLRSGAALRGAGLIETLRETREDRKRAFVRNTARPAGGNPHRLEQPTSPYTLLAGTVIAASLLTGLNSDLPGFVIAQVTEPVYDTVSGAHLLIPQGARLIGQYDNSVAYGQDRALIVWQRILLPDGASVEIENLPATDAAGRTGIKDRVDTHPWQLLKGVALATVLGIGSELVLNSNNDIARALERLTQSTTSRAGERLVERDLNRQPTIKVRPGWPLRVIVHQDLILKPYPTR